MLETFYHTFGFFGAILIAFLCFAFFILWVAGIAGLVYDPESETQTWQLVACVLFPPYPILWLFYDINNERKKMQEEE